MPDAGNFLDLNLDEITRSDFDAFVDIMIADIEKELRTAPENSDLAAMERAFINVLKSAQDRMESDEHAKLVQEGFYVGFSFANVVRAKTYRGNLKNAQCPRTKRGQSPKTKLRLKGLLCVLANVGDITTETLWDMLEVGPVTYDDDDIKLRLDGDSIVVEDLRTNASPKNVLIQKSSLRKYLSDARNT